LPSQPDIYSALTFSLKHAFPKTGYSFFV